MSALVLLARFSYPALLGLLLACGLGAPLSEDLILLAAGGLVAKGLTNLPLTIATAYLGVVLGDLLLFSLGRKLGQKALAHPRLARVCPPARLEALSLRLARSGPLAIAGARFMAGMRACTFLGAGLLGMPRKRFLLADALAAVVWVPGVILLARTGLTHLDGGIFLVLRRGVIALGAGAGAGLLARALATQLAAASANVAGGRELEDARP